MANPSAADGRKLIIAPTVGHYGPSLGQVLVVWAASAFLYVGIVGGAFVFFPMFGLAAESEIQPEVVAPTEIVSEPKEFDTTNDSLGEDDSIPSGFEVERIENVDMPGPVEPDAAAALPDPRNTGPMNMQAPAGWGPGIGGDSNEQGITGPGKAIGMPGGPGGTMVTSGFTFRSGSTRQKLLREGGGNAASEKAVADGLKFLALHQAVDGHWGLSDFPRHARTAPLPAGKVIPDNSQPMTTRRNDTAGTAFGLLPFLAAGITNNPGKKSKLVDYTKTVDRAITRLIALQSKASSDRGFFGGDMYSHGLATIAMCEAYGLTSDARIKTSAQLGINYIVSSQDPAGGGWRYSPRTPGDTSVTGWQLMALKSGQMAGLNVPRSVFKKVERFLDSCESSNKGGYSYVPGGGESLAMTSVGALCRQYLGVNPRNPSLLGSVRRIKATKPGANDIYYEYYATQVMHHMGGDAWNYWNRGPDRIGMRDAYIAKQDKGEGGRPGQKGSFAGNDHVGGRLGATSLSLLSLEVYYRHLPLYRRDMGGMKPEK